MKNEIFSETFARRKNLFTNLDGRLKVSFTVGAILLAVSSKVFYVPLIILFFVITSLFLMRISLKLIILRLSEPLGVAIVMLFIKIFFCRNSLSLAILILLKIISSSSLIVLLSFATPLDSLLEALRWFKLPAVWIEICMITYRYIFVLIEDAVTVFDSQRLRLGYVNLAQSLRSIASLAGIIIIRAYDQSVATYEAMLLRGYKERQ